MRPLFFRAKPLHGPATARFRTFRAALTSRWTSIWQCAHLLDTDRQVLWDRAAALPAFLRGGPRVDDREQVTGPFSLVAQHRDHHARRSVENLPVEPGLLPDVCPWTFDRSGSMGFFPPVIGVRAAPLFNPSVPLPKFIGHSFEPSPRPQTHQGRRRQTSIPAGPRPLPLRCRLADRRSQSCRSAAPANAPSSR